MVIITINNFCFISKIKRTYYYLYLVFLYKIKIKTINDTRENKTY